MKEIDARGLDCPAPVIKTKAVIDDDYPEKISILVDNDAARQNVCRFLESRQYEIEVRQKGSVFQINGKSGQTPYPKESDEVKLPSDSKKIMVMIATDRVGNGDDELGRKLMISFIKTLKEMDSELWRLVFVNNGVKLTVEESQVLDDLKELAADGCSILVCGTCLSHFNMLEKKQVGETTNMLDIVTSMQLADTVINI